ncbi:MAG TPA: winged helix-turn-helix transcriptional regulator [Candidatus Scatomorpha pullistercoris]|uniref:Winged helix-turn-helix transcriptional regulator n=1 Tax=Candidatus Scatomorpha pullistercoris TaxID=2840929 RepID=A0A9D1G452_9FIRM|nr:winged helix-turn-helix transcriptional regulator [Candidatus Scatomorpha pullistercoris]
MGLQETMRALADPTRRGILELLRDGELTAGEISERFPMSNAAVSKHLAVLKEAGLVRDIRRGKYIFYELNTSVLEDVLVFVSSLGLGRGEESEVRT